jgi:hypothetical protein
MDDGDPQETIDLMGDDGVVERVVVPRVWHLPSRPAAGISVRDRDGKVWSRRPEDPVWVDLWYAGGMNPLHWHDLLGRRGPLTEVL